MCRRFLIRAVLSQIALVFWASSCESQETKARPSDVSPLGFAPASRRAELDAEAKALAVPTPDSARKWLRELTEEPHVAGTKADYQTALFVRDQLRDWGWTADLAEYEVLLNYPVGPSTLKLRAPVAQSLSLVEQPHRADKDSADPAAFGAFHGYGVSGNVVGQVVYANFGQPEDFDTLERLGIAVKDKIVLVRYGALFRGLKVRNAQQRGAKGVLIYSDPADDGYAKGDVYPDGPYRPATALQRGSVQFLSLGPGDPSTPDGPSIKGAKRLPIDPAMGLAIGSPDWDKATKLRREDYFATIPSLPIGYGAAQPILEAMGGPTVPNGWQGGLPLPYHAGPGPAVVEFSVAMDYQVRTIWNVIATLKGTEEPERWVMIGNHRDAWVYGAVDPGSGTAATLETCRALGAAVRGGWKPRRTLVYASWDAEEYGLVGSTEWADEHAREIDTKALMLLNVDSAVGGSELDLDGVPSLRDLMLDACAAVIDVRSGLSLRTLWTEKKRTQWAATAPIEFSEKAAAFSPMLNPLGSGSDYTAFLDHLGVPCLDVGFGGKYGVYHSIFDNFYWMEKFGDPEFLTHATAAKLYTVVAMRAAAAEVFPYRFTPYAQALNEHLDDLRRMVERKARAATRGSKPTLKFDGRADLVQSIRSFQEAAQTLDRSLVVLSAHDGIEPARLARVNDALQRVERAFLLGDGLPGRPWFKHAVYAPGLTTGYACWPLPGVRQAVIDNDHKMLALQISALVIRVDAATSALRAANAEAAKAIEVTGKEAAMNMLMRNHPHE